MDEKTYKPIQEEHTLPQYNRLADILEDTDYDSDKETTNQLIKKITKKLVAKLEEQAAILESLLNPDQTISSMHEAEIFHEQEREEITNNFMECMRMGREFAIVELENKDYVGYLTRLTTFWEEKTPYFIQLHKKIHASWSPKKDLKTPIEYLG